MTDKEKLDAIRAEVQKYIYAAHKAHTNITEGNFAHLLSFIDSLQEEPVEKKCMFTKDSYTNEDRKVLCEECKEKCEYSKKEEPVSESMNTESMIESYKQRLISQANGMKNSPFIDMCLASYKHGINETLDTLNLSNVERTVKDWKEMPVSKELEEAAKEYANSLSSKCDKTYVAVDFKAGAKWQKEQFETNRLAACDRQTEEEAECEQDFVMGIIEKEHRQPTFDDAIKYGMRLKEEEIKEALLSEVLPCFMHGGEADEVVAKLDEVLNQKK